MFPTLRKIGLIALWLGFAASLCGSMGCGCSARQPVFHRPGWIIPNR